MARMKLKPSWSTRKKRRSSATATTVDKEGVFGQFIVRHPEIAAQETRTIFVSEDFVGVPRGEYIFHEAFCMGRACDCRRVMFMVHRRDLGAKDVPKHIVTIGYGWESLGFYVKWMGGNREDATLMRGPTIEPNSPFCAYADELLDLFEKTCLSSDDYVDRVRNHYALFKGL